MWLLAGGGLLILLYLAVVSPLLGLEESWSQELASRSLILAKYQHVLENKTKVAEANQALKTALTEVEGRFLTGGTPAVASAELQEILKNLIKEHGVLMTSAKVLPTREAGPYLEVPVQVHLSATITQLVTLLYHLEHQVKLLFIPDLDINAPSVVRGEKAAIPLQINMVISGVIKKGEAS